MIYKGTEQENHPGNKVRWPNLKKNEDKQDHSNPILSWQEGILVKPVNGQIIVTEEHGTVVLTHGQYPLVEIIEL